MLGARFVALLRRWFSRPREEDLAMTRQLLVDYSAAIDASCDLLREHLGVDPRRGERLRGDARSGSAPGFEYWFHGAGVQVRLRAESAFRGRHASRDLVVEFDFLPLERFAELDVHFFIEFVESTGATIDAATLRRCVDALRARG